MKTKELLLVILLYVIVAIATYFAYLHLFKKDNGNGDDNVENFNPKVIILDEPTVDLNELSVNGLNEIISVGDSVQCVGKATLRSSAQINDGLIDNIVKDDARGQLGKVLDRIVDSEGNVWCKVDLINPVSEWLITYDEVYVLENQITKL